MCFGTPDIAPAPPPAAPASSNPVLSNLYDPSSPESGMAAEKGSVSNKAKGTSQLKVNLDPTTQAMGSGGLGLQINK